MIRPIREVRARSEGNVALGLLGSLIDGAPKGGTLLLSGCEGAGKSTLLLQACASVASTNEKVLYLTGEESEEDVRARLDRLGLPPDRIFVDAGDGGTLNLAKALQDARTIGFRLIIVDSLQTVHIPGEPIGPLGEKAIVSALRKYCKSTGTIAILIGQLNTDDSPSGTRAVSHGVDATLDLSLDGEIRVLRCKKCRWHAAPVQMRMTMLPHGLEVLDD